MGSEYNQDTDTWKLDTPTIARYSGLDKYKTETDAQKLEREITEIGAKIKEIYTKIYESLPEDIKQNGLPSDYKVSDAQIQNFINNAIAHQSEIIDNLKKMGFTITGTSFYYGGKVVYEVKEIDNNVLFEMLKNAFLEVALKNTPLPIHPIAKSSPTTAPTTTPTTNPPAPTTNPPVLTPNKIWRGGTIGISKLFVDPRMVPFGLLMASDPTLITSSITALVMLSCHIKDHLIKSKKIDDTDYFHNLFKDLFKNEESDETTNNNSYKYLYAILIGPCTACENIMPCIINILTKSKDTLTKIFQPNKGGKSRKRKGKKSKKTKRQKTRK